MNKEFQELKLKTAVELQKLLKDGREKLRALKFNLLAGKVKNVNELRETKKHIANILTILNSPETQNTEKTK